MARVLITGCGGFVGRVLAAQMVDDGHVVYGAERDANADLPEGISPCSGDLADPDVVARVVDRSEPDWIVHLAAQSSVKKSFDDPAGTLASNTVPALNLLERLRSSGSKARILLVGSADEYGVVAPDAMPVSERHALDPQSPYALAKAIQAGYGELYASRYAIDVLITRSFNHTGPGQRDDFVLPAFARQLCEIRAGIRPPILRVGNLEVRRDFTDVADVCDAYVSLLEKGHTGEVYNVCSGRSVCLRDVLDRMITLSGVEATVEIDPDRLRPVDMPELRGDAGRIHEHTGWGARVAFDSTLKALLDYWEARVTR